MNRHGINPYTKYPLFSEVAPDFAALEWIPLPSACTVLFIAADARSVHTDTIVRAADRMLSSGLRYVCAWGPDCERVHDIFDEVHAGNGTGDPAFTLMITWHSNESLEEALWFFIANAFPVDAGTGAASHLAVTVDRADWTATVDTSLSNLSAFTTRMLNGGSEPIRN